MNTITISVPTEKDVKLLEQLAHKMGYKVQISLGTKSEKKKNHEVGEVTLLSEPALAEAWLDPEDDVYNNL
ncbi:hypothetical protein OKW21_000461 [Catalinimonas alkaloidigena]|uniref:hypothetical protein n=1 Tax=Catalinimonas alkaloidigena TaxID=1075417 RepID=UPI00240715D6|nr:hypothetical protein [Catalinimonas alkaloidigena]MDF9795198.1 hypothetical protein [Catalinimonas alkaloidigena]